MNRALHGSAGHGDFLVCGISLGSLADRAVWGFCIMFFFCITESGEMSAKPRMMICACSCHRGLGLIGLICSVVGCRSAETPQSGRLLC